jgi:hypothetical protein
VVKALSAQPDVMRGLVRVAAQGAPAGSGVLTRRTGRAVDTIRGGVLNITTGGVIITDAEALFGTDLTYRLVDTPTSRYIQSNRVLNPKFAVDLSNWTFNTARTADRETTPSLAPPRDAATSVRIGPRTGGAGAGGLPERLLARCSPSGLTTGRWYVSGQLRYDSPDIWLWDDVRTAGTWQTIRNRGSWAQVKAANSPLAGQPFASLYAAVLNSGGGTVVAPFQILGVQTGDNGGWATFQAVVDIPAGAGANCQLAFYQGTVTREWTVTWWLSTLMVCPEAESLKAGAVLPYFDGDSNLAVKAPNPAENLAPGYDWKALTGDASMVWQGTPNASWSQFTGPSQIFAEVETYIGRPDALQLPRTKLPVFLSDPVAPQLSQWFDLIEIGDLTFAARQQLFDVLGRGAAIAVNQKRGWATGDLRLMTYTLAEAEIAERMFESGRILYWRNPDPRFPENGWWVAIGDTKAGRVGQAAAWAPERLWSVPFVRVERPAGLISATSSITWGITKANYTWQQLRDAKRDWLDTALSAPGSST